MGKNNFELLKIAQSHLGQNGTRFRRFCGLPAGAAWCNAYVDYVAAEGDDESLYFDGRKMTYCPTSMSWCRKNLAQIPIYLAMEMDIIYFDWEPNGVPNHIGFVRERKSDREVYTIEGNTSGGIVAQKTRTAKYVCGVFRPHFKPSGYDANKRLSVDGYFGYNTIVVMQRWLGQKQDAILKKSDIRALQKKVGVPQDGSWGVKTSKAVQKLIGTAVDGAFGPKSVKAFQSYLNKAVFKSAPKPTPSVKTAQDKACDYAKYLISKSYKYVTYNEQKVCCICGGGKKFGGNCIAFVSQCLKHGGGVPVKCTASGILNNAFADELYKAKDKVAKWESRNGNKGKWKIIWNGGKQLSDSVLQKGDILICYNGSTYKHTALYMGNGKIADCNSDKGAAIRNYSALNNPCKIAVRWLGK